MYTLEDTIARSYDRTVGVRSIDAGDVNVRQLLNNNSEVWLTLSNDHYDGTRALDLFLLKETIYQTDPDLTVNEWLSSIGNETLPTIDRNIVVKYFSALAMDAYDAGYVVKHSTGRIEQDDDVADYELTDLSLQKVGVDTVAMRNHVLATVGGYWHLVDGDSNAYYVKDGGKTAQLCGRSNVGLTSLDRVSAFTQIPLSTCEITATDAWLKDGIHITTQHSLKDRTVWLSVGGHLLYLGREYSIVGEHTVRLDWDRLGFYKRYLRARQSIDMGSVDSLTGIGPGVGLVSRQRMDEDDVIKAVMNLSQSFLVVLEEPSITTELTFLEDAGLPGKWYVKEHPYRTPLGSDGRSPSVELINERINWVVSTSPEDGMVDNYYSDYQNKEITDLYTGQNETGKTHYRNTLGLLDIRVSTLVQE